MKPVPWKLLVMTEAGAPESPRPGRPIRVRGGVDGASEWLASVRPVLEAPSSGSPVPTGPGTKLDFSDPRAFEPRTIVEALSPTGAVDPKRIDSIMHDPAFQRLESAFRGLRLLFAHATDEIEVWILSAPKKELVERFRESIFDPWIAEAQATPWTLILIDYDLSHRSEDLEILRGLGGMAKTLQSPIVAAASPGFFDLRHMSHVTALPDIAGRLMDPAHAAWRTFQASEEARWVALTINRYLQRDAYDIESIGFKESSEEAKPESRLWGRGVWLVGAAFARSIGTHHHPLDLSGRGGHFDDLPSRPFPVAANEMVSLSTEVPMPEEKAQEFSRAAFTPLVGRIRSNAAILPIVVTVFRLQPGRLTVEGTLAYQLMAGWLAHHCDLLLSNLPEGDERVAVEFLRTELVEVLGGLAGNEPDKAVTVEPIRQEIDGQSRLLANVHVRPGVPLEGKQIEFEFVLPLGRE